MTNNYLQLVNQHFPVRDKERPCLLEQAPFTDKNLLLDSVVAKKLKALVEAVGLQDKVIVTDGFRTKEMQQQIWDETIQEKGELFTRKYVAKPGCSEHELGLAVDMGLAEVANDYICPSFSEGPVVERFLKEMPEYGFILRYPEGKEAVTGISYEPWHFRYVGTPHSQIITQQGWVLEEYIAFLMDTRGKLNEG
ncbi:MULTISPECIES: D,D-carboxypeptidase/D,D-dipeptidase VanXY [Vagococcus]|uniref:D,D-carboxypeptidase/D,D-dipeptidase VanXY n=1 Tax=Vagococcus TaxID=2737 RepID=UPI002FC8B64F